jgi:Zn-dependent metalloprotease
VQSDPPVARVSAARTVGTPIVDAIVGFPHAVVDLAESIVRTFLSVVTLSLHTGPDGPPQPAWLTAVFDLVRRELRTFFNRTPRAVDDVVTTDTSLSIDVLGNDSDDDALRITSVTQPANGTVSINRDGTITYTPDENFSGTDTFTYTVSDADSRFHLHGLFGLFSRGHSDTATVTVNVSPPPTGAPRFTGPPVTDGVEPGGVIYGHVSATDPDGDEITYGLADLPDAIYATVEVDPATGEFVFVPTDLARYRAAVDETAREITFRFTASDGEHTASVEYAATVVPLHPDDDGVLDLADLDTLAQYGDITVSENEDGQITAIIGTFTDDKVTDENSAVEVLNRLANLLGTPSIDGGADVQQTTYPAESGGVGETFYRFTQSVDGIPVVGGDVILTVLEDGTVTGVFSSVDRTAYFVDTAPDPMIATPEDAIAAASQVLLATLAETFSDEEVADIASSLTGVARLVIYAPDDGSAPALAWHVGVYTAGPDPEVDETDALETVFVGAGYYLYANGPYAGSMLDYDSTVADAWSTVTGTATGLRHGLFPVSYVITFQRDGSRERLVDPGRNIWTYSYMTVELNSRGEIIGRSVGPVSTSPWEPSAVSAHGNMRLVYDYFRDVLGRASYTGRGSDATTIRVALWQPDTDNAQFIAFADGSVYFRFGNDSEAALDVVAHEYTHAVMHSIHGGFSNRPQAAALGEAYGDILGKLIEGKADSGEWEFGEDAAAFNPWRDLSDPSRFGGRSHFSEFVDGDNQAHKNSTIFSHAAYLMMTDSRTAGVSDDTWARVFYGSIFRFGRDATFQDARNAVIASAAVQGLNREEQAAIADAFDRVGITQTRTIKIVLRWGETPRDLDSHLTGPPSLGDGPRFHVYYGSPNYFRDGSYYSETARLNVNLDYDDTTSYGPETTSIRNLVNGDYYFYVRDYTNGGSTNSTALSRSGATVSVIDTGDRSRIHLFYVDGESPGTTWTVFKLTISGPAENRTVTITPINTYSYEQPYFDEVYAM